MTNTGRDLMLDGDVKCSLYYNIRQLWKTTSQLQLSSANVYRLFPVLEETADVVTVCFNLLMA